jgi:hypothetical protein
VVKYPAAWTLLAGIAVEDRNPVAPEKNAEALAANPKVWLAYPLALQLCPIATVALLDAVEFVPNAKLL